MRFLMIKPRGDFPTGFMLAFWRINVVYIKVFIAWDQWPLHFKYSWCWTRSGCLILPRSFDGVNVGFVLQARRLWMWTSSLVAWNEWLFHFRNAWLCNPHRVVNDPTCFNVVHIRCVTNENVLGTKVSIIAWNQWLVEFRNLRLVFWNETAMISHYKWERLNLTRPRCFVNDAGCVLYVRILST